MCPTLYYHCREVDRLRVASWLLVCALLIAVMVFVGGYTRLSGSGLSITEWKPIHGVIPPMGEAEWLEEFEAYRQSPQYHKINKGMSVEEFKTIYWPEYWHRVIGRVIGIVFFVPFVVFLARRSFSLFFGLRLAGIFALGGLQGIVGWYMVKSGLVDVPHVSHLRLALHLGIAFLLFGLLVWNALELKQGQEKTLSTSASTHFRWVMALLLLQIILGAFMAGLHAGLIYNTFPLMNGFWFPPEAFETWQNLRDIIENIAAVQFAHRWVPLALFIAMVFWWRKHGKDARNSPAVRALLVFAALFVGQFCLGVATLLQIVPLPLALLHQITALALFAAGIVAWHGLRKREEYDV